MNGRVDDGFCSKVCVLNQMKEYLWTCEFLYSVTVDFSDIWVTVFQELFDFFKYLNLNSNKTR